jgi:hypothetical protein
MSFQLRNIREIPGDSLAKFTNEISRRLSRFLTRNQFDQLDDKEDIFIDGQDFDTVVRLQDHLTGTTKFLFDKPYYPPFEPDNDILRLWIRGVNLGNEMTDWSLHGKDIDLFGEPVLVDGAPHDDGIKTGGVKSIALRMNRPTSPTVNDEYIQVADAPSVGIDGITTGISYFVRFRALDIAEQGGYSRTLFEKIEGATVEDAVVAMITNDGKLRFSVKRSNIWYNKETATSTIAVDTVYDVWFTFDQPTKTIHIYVNNIDKSLTTSTDPNLQSDLDNHDLWIGQRGKGPEAGFFYGDLYDFRIYREKVVSAAEVGYLYSNKWTISNIPFGQVMVANYWATVLTGDIISPSACSWSLISFTPTSWTVCTATLGASYTALSYTSASFTV